MTLYGQDAAIAAFLDAKRSGRLHHAWLLAGPRGVGKGSFARAAALRLLAEGADPLLGAPGLSVPADHRTARLVAAGSHPDIMTLSRLYRDKTKDVARSISVDQVRGLSRLFATAPTFSARRVVIVDAVDDLERPGANALLKLLEEPPADAVFLLVSHAPGRLLPTIRSRCRMLRFGALDDDAMRAALGAALPDAEPAELAGLIEAGAGSPGRALGFEGLDIAGLERAMDALVVRGDPDNFERSALARSLGSKAAQPRYEAFLERVPSRIAAEARRRSGSALAEAIAAWERAREVAAGAVRLSLDPQITVFELAGLLAALAPGYAEPR